MSKNAEPVATEAAGNEDARYEVVLSAKFTLADFIYRPGEQNHHVVDQTIHDAMKEAGVIASVKQLP